MSTAITNYSTRSSKSGEERFQEFYDNSGIVSGERFCFNSFRQVVYGHENVLVPSRRREWPYEIDASYVKDLAYLNCILGYFITFQDFALTLTSVTLCDQVMGISVNSRPIKTGINDFLSGVVDTMMSPGRVNTIKQKITTTAKQKLLLLGAKVITFLLLVYFTAAKIMLGSVNAVRHMLMLPVQVIAAEGSIQSSIHPVLSNFGQLPQYRQLMECVRALVDKKRVIVTESSIRKDLHLMMRRRITPLFATMMVQASEKVGEDSDHLTDSTQVLDLEKAKDAQAKEIAALKKRIQRLERKKMSRPTGLKRLKKVGMSRRVESSEDQESLVAPEDVSKQGRSIADIDVDVEVTLIDETQERQDDELMFDIGVLDTDEIPVEVKLDEKDEQSTKLDDSTAAEVPLKRKDQIALDEQIVRDIQAKLDVELIEEQKLARKQEEESNIALIESWENTQAMMEADRLLAERL
ncbi:hypothetical protein Tco_0966431 [Tanacetum coccineum]